jgi:negative regulator of sigma-B (phosphoserine phosphatase)
MSAPWLDVAVAWRPCAGELACGDQELRSVRDDRAVLAVVDGLGHGRAAAAVAAEAVAAVAGAVDLSLEQMFARCHARLARGRGVVMSIVTVDRELGRLRWAGVGNVDACLVHADGSRARLLALGGILGHTLPRLHVGDLRFAPGDLLVVVTDGIVHTFVDTVTAMRTAATQAIADLLVASHSRPDDDALALVARLIP